MTRRIALVLAGPAVGVLLCVAASHAQTLDPCQSNCIQVSVGDVPATPLDVGASVRVPILFQQATGEGVGEIAAVALSLSIPGLELANCDNPDANGITSAVEVPDGVDYRVVVENTSCTDDPARPCLCPGTGQQRANQANIVVFGPKFETEQELKDRCQSDPANCIPVLPNGELVALTLKVGSGAQATVPLHLYAETDTVAAPVKPDFAAYLSVGDKNAVDQTGDRDAGVSKVTTANKDLTVNQQAGCCGDKDGNGTVSAAEATSSVNAFGRRDKSLNPSADCDGNGTVAANEATRAVLNFGRRECTP